MVLNLWKSVKACNLIVSYTTFNCYFSILLLARLFLLSPASTRALQFHIEAACLNFQNTSTFPSLSLVQTFLLLHNYTYIYTYVLVHKGFECVPMVYKIVENEKIFLLVAHCQHSWSLCTSNQNIWNQKAFLMRWDWIWTMNWSSSGFS